MFQSRVAFLTVSAVQRGIPFALLPLFVTVLSPTEYGQVGVVTAVFTLGSMTFGLGQDIVSYRYFFSEDDSGRRSLRAAALVSHIGPLVIGIAGAGAVWITQPNLGDTPPSAIALSLLASATFVAAWQYPAVYYRSTERTGHFFGLSLLYTAAVALVKVILVVGFDAGVLGWAISDLAGSFILLLCVARLTWRTLQGRGSVGSAEFHSVLALGLPVVASQFARWMGGFSDRLLIVALLSPAAAGSYLLASQLVTIGNIFVIELSRFLQPAIGKRDRPLRQFLRENLGRHLAFTLATVGGVVAVAQGFVWLGLASDYQDVALLASALAVALLFLSFNYVGGDIIAVHLGRTRYLAGVSVAVGLSTAAANYALISAFGLWGAVVVNVSGQVVTSVLLWVPICRERQAVRS